MNFNWFYTSIYLNMLLVYLPNNNYYLKHTSASMNNQKLQQQIHNNTTPQPQTNSQTSQSIQTAIHNLNINKNTQNTPQSTTTPQQTSTIHKQQTSTSTTSINTNPIHTNSQPHPNHTHHHNCQNQHQNNHTQNPHHMMRTIITQNNQAQHPHRQCSHHNYSNYNHQHTPNCKFYNPQQHKQNLSLTPEQPIIELPKNLTIENGIAEAILNYSKGDLHKTWTILDKLEKAKLVDKKLQGVFILKELGLNKGTAPLKCLTTNNGDISKTLKDLMSKQQQKSNIAYITSLPEQEYTVIIDGLSLATCDQQIKKMCLSNIIQQRQKALIRMYMLIELVSGFFYIPREYMTHHLMERIKHTVGSLKTKSKKPFKLKLMPVEGLVHQQISKIIDKIKTEDLKNIILVSENSAFLTKCLKDHGQIRAMQGQKFIEEVTKKQDKDYLNELISLK